jgi:hypothetical protein
VKKAGRSNAEKLSYLIYSLFLLSLSLAPQFSQNVTAIAGFLCCEYEVNTLKLRRKKISDITVVQTKEPTVLTNYTKILLYPQIFLRAPVK